MVPKSFVWLLALVGAFALALLVWAAIEHFSTAPPPANARALPKSEWPEELVALLNEAEKSDIHFAEVAVYQMPYGEYYWASEGSPELLALMRERWKLIPADGDQKNVRFARERAAFLVPPRAASDVSYYASENWLEGDKGHQYCAMDDSANGRIVVRYYYNW